uniref:Uncharacterized protein n=1 Tax=Utricularia reniformis TaxID=192314 RepID=A0A1Y0AZX3_9LAMI|nr:hypothetical protein AEK19_MT0412 [Utricularia reniformis]ART30678.1 hypothetical protein AEK19_MT0412 [Utricularia reniformis]
MDHKHKTYGVSDHTIACLLLNYTIDHVFGGANVAESVNMT